MKNKLDNDMINDTIAFIESRLTENIQINELAEQSFFSKTHYQRLFHSIVGETVMEYIKKRRLQLALDELCDTKTPILEIALKYGYESHEGFTRAFKNYYGVAPLRYRKLNAGQKNYYHEGAMKMRKVSSEVIARIKKNMGIISKSLEQSAKCVAGLSEDMKNMGNDLGNEGATLVICSKEAWYFAKRMDSFKESINSFIEYKQMDFEIYGKINTFTKVLDDITFQANLLRFLSGIEMARAGEANKVLASIEKQFSELAVNIGNNKSSMIDLINDIVSLIRADIRNDAVSMIKDAISLLKNADDEGKIIAASIKNAAEALRYNGNGIMCIENILSNRLAGITPVVELFEAYKSDLEESEFEISENYHLPVPSEARISEVRSAIYSVEEIAFSMNVAAFNASIETARCGNEKSLIDCSDKIVRYAGLLPQTCKSCEELFDESVKLSDMLKNGRAANVIALTKKMVIDIAFQGKILVTQLGLEAERANIEVFKNLAKNADNALHIILGINRNSDISKCKEELVKYYELTLKHTKECHAGASEAGAKGVPFEYIASEYDLFVERIKAGIDCL